MGSPPFCKPECIIHSDCPSNQACVNEKCRNPCEGACGIYAQCFVQNHVPVCLCSEGFTGDPFRECRPKPQEGKDAYLFIIYYYNYLYFVLRTAILIFGLRRLFNKRHT